MQSSHNPLTVKISQDCHAFIAHGTFRVKTYESKNNI